jgi:hypothetical protein
MLSIWPHALIVVDIVSMKVFVWVLGQLFTSAVEPNGGILDSHLFFFDRYSDLAEYHRLKGRASKVDRLAAIAEAYYQAAPDDDEPEAAAMAMPVPRPWMNTNAVSTPGCRNHQRTNHPGGLHRPRTDPASRRKVSSVSRKMACVATRPPACQRLRGAFILGAPVPWYLGKSIRHATSTR